MRKVKIITLLTVTISTIPFIVLHTSTAESELIINSYYESHQALSYKLSDSKSKLKEELEEGEIFEFDEVSREGSKISDSFDMSNLLKHPDADQFAWEVNVKLLTEAYAMMDKLHEQGMNEIYLNDPLQIITISDHETSPSSGTLDSKTLTNLGAPISSTTTLEDYFKTINGAPRGNGDGPYQLEEHRGYLQRAGELFPNYVGVAYSNGNIRTWNGLIGHPYNILDSTASMYAYVSSRFSGLKDEPNLETTTKIFAAMSLGYNSGPNVVMHINNQHNGDYSQCTHSTGLSWINVPYRDILAISRTVDNELVNAAIDELILDESLAFRDIVNSESVWNSIIDAYEEESSKSGKLNVDTLRSLRNRTDYGILLGNGYSTQYHRLKYPYYQYVCYKMNKAYLEGKRSIPAQ